MRMVLFIPILVLAAALTACGLFDSEPALRLRAVPVSAVETLLEIRSEPGRALTLTRDGESVASFTLAGRDTFYIDAGLAPATAYTWQVRGGGETARAKAATLDTTSSQFTWQTFTFGGEVNSSVLYDVAIIGEDNIWAVGEIYVRDEEHVNGYQMYNAVHWDGVEWELKQVPYHYQGYNYYSPILSVFAFAENDVWFGIGNMIHWNGSRYSPIQVGLGMSINKIWGHSSTDLYIVGNNGSLAHYNGASWRKLESGTRSHFSDIWGAKNPKSGKWEIMAVAAEPGESHSMAVVSIQGDRVTALNQKGLADPINTVWFVPGIKYLIGGSHVHASYQLGRDWDIDRQLDPVLTESTALRGNGLNDMVLAGSFGLLLHFNGAGWHHFDATRFPDGTYGRVAMAKNLAAITGSRSREAIVLLGTRP